MEFKKKKKKKQTSFILPEVSLLIRNIYLKFRDNKNENHLS